MATEQSSGQVCLSVRAKQASRHTEEGYVMNNHDNNRTGCRSRTCARAICHKHVYAFEFFQRDSLWLVTGTPLRPGASSLSKLGGFCGFSCSLNNPQASSQGSHGDFVACFDCTAGSPTDTDSQGSLTWQMQGLRLAQQVQPMRVLWCLHMHAGALRLEVCTT